MKAYKVKRHRVVATSALREIEDREYIIDNIQINTGFKVEVINYAQETFLKSKALRVKCGKYLKENKDTVIRTILTMEVEGKIKSLTGGKFVN
jgi:exopolyphosphatase/guanosine-5'-triphosphate,3'-diphosphate pyrophosphatase